MKTGPPSPRPAQQQNLSRNPRAFVVCFSENREKGIVRYSKSRDAVSRPHPPSDATIRERNGNVIARPHCHLHRTIVNLCPVYHVHVRLLYPAKGGVSLGLEGADDDEDK